MWPEIEYYTSDKLEILCLEFYFRTEYSPYLTSRVQNECFLNCVLALTASYLQFSASCSFARAIEWAKPWHGRWQIITFFGSPSHQWQLIECRPTIWKVIGSNPIWCWALLLLTSPTSDHNHVECRAGSSRRYLTTHDVKS